MSDAAFDLWAFGFLCGATLFGWMRYFRELDPKASGVVLLSIFAVAAGYKAYRTNRGVSGD